MLNEDPIVVSDRPAPSRMSPAAPWVRPPDRTCNERVGLVYILAASHSGSTLLAMLLGAHREICTVGELNAAFFGDVAEKYRCSCRRLIRECDFWIAVSEEMRRRGFQYDVLSAKTSFQAPGSRYATRLLRPLHRGALLEGLRDMGLSVSRTWRRSYADAQARNAALADSLRAITGASLIVDSSKIALRLKFLLRNPQLDVRVVRLVRDGRGVALTYMHPYLYADAKDPAMRAEGKGTYYGDLDYPMEVAATRWRRANEEAENLLARLDPSRYVRVRYEDICANPAQTLAGVFRFLGVDPAGWNPEFKSVDHHVVGNGMRLDRASEVELDDRWRSDLSTADLATFERIAGRLNRRYGYS